MVPAIFNFMILHTWREAWGQRGKNRVDRRNRPTEQRGEFESLLAWLAPQQPCRLGGASEEIRASSALIQGGHVEDYVELAFVVCLGVGKGKPCCEGRART